MKRLSAECFGTFCLIFAGIGALAASLLLRGLFPSHASLGAARPAGSDAQSFILELVFTAILMFVILQSKSSH